MTYIKAQRTHLENTCIPMKYAFPVFIQHFNTKDIFHKAAGEIQYLTQKL
jgi:hypothetical protein